jgi:hypothetical protein
MIHALQLLALACSALFAGAMLTEGFVLLPYWRSLAAPDFFAWYQTNATRLVDFFGPITWLAGLATLATAIASTWTAHAGRWWSVAGAGLVLCAVATFFVYFERANASFVDATLSAGELPAALERWGAWHWARTALSVAAVAVTAAALRRA